MALRFNLLGTKFNLLGTWNLNLTCLVLGFNLLEDLNNVLGHVGVKAGRRLITEQEWWIGQHLRSEGQTLAFATGNALDATLDADQSIGTFGESEL